MICAGAMHAVTSHDILHSGLSRLSGDCRCNSYITKVGVLKCNYFIDPLLKIFLGENRNTYSKSLEDQTLKSYSIF